jgi:hypothetical protein
MRRTRAEKRLADAGFEIDWSVTGSDPESGFSGRIDPIGRTSINGDCRGCVILANTRAGFYARAIAEAESLAGDLSPCDKTDCDFHDE